MNSTPSAGCGFPQQAFNSSWVWVITNSNPKPHLILSKQEETGVADQPIFRAPPPTSLPVGGGGGGWMMWPPRSYPCNFCKRDFRSAQALGGHMNVHRRDRALLKQEDPRTTAPMITPSRHQQDHHLNNTTILRHPDPSVVNKSSTAAYNTTSKGGFHNALARTPTTRCLSPNTNTKPRALAAGSSSSRHNGFLSSSKCCSSMTTSCSPSHKNYRRLSKLSCGCKSSDTVQQQIKLCNRGFISCNPRKSTKVGGNDIASYTKRQKKDGNDGGYNGVRLISSSWSSEVSNKGSSSVDKCVTTLHESEDNLLDLELRLGDRSTN